MTWIEIEAGSKRAQKYHFDDTRFYGSIWINSRKPHLIYVSYVSSLDQSKGNFKCWLTNLAANKTLTIKVVRPVDATAHILEGIGGFIKNDEELPYPVMSKQAEVWTREGVKV